MKPNILFLANPQSFTHDYKWIKCLNNHVNCYVIPLKNQYNSISSAELNILEKQNIKVLKPISPFSLLRFYLTLFDLYYLINQIKKYKVQLIHIHYADPSVLWAIFRRLIKKPIFLTTRGTDILVAISNVYKKNNLINYFLRPLYKLAIHKVDHFFCTSENQRFIIQKLFQVTDNVDIVPTGIDWEELQAVNTRLLPKSLELRKYWLFPRGMKPVYNHELSLMSLKLIESKLLYDYKFVFLNKDSSDRAYVNKILSMMNEMPEIDFEFFDSLDHSTMIEIIRNAELIIITNLSDGSPVTVMEAMALKKSIIIPPIEYDVQIFKNLLRFRDYSSEALIEAFNTELDGYYTSEMRDENVKIIKEKCRRDVQMKFVYRKYCELINFN